MAQGAINAKIDLSKAMEKLLTEYGEEIKEEVNKQIVDTGKQTTNQLKQRPSETKSHKHYAKGWTEDMEITWHGSTLTIYNKTKPQLTHLLNNGHHYVTRSGVRLFDVIGDEHIDHASDFANDLLVKKVEDALKQ